MPATGPRASPNKCVLVLIGADEWGRKERSNLDIPVSHVVAAVIHTNNSMWKVAISLRMYGVIQWSTKDAVSIG